MCAHRRSMLKNMAKPAATLSEESSQSDMASAFERRQLLRQKNCLKLPRRRLIHLAADVAYGLNACWEFVICYFNKESYKQGLSSHCSKQDTTQVRQNSSLKAISDLYLRPSQFQPPRHHE